MNATSKTKQKIITEATLIKADGTRICMGVISHNYSIPQLIGTKIKLLFTKDDASLRESMKHISIINEIKSKLKGGN